MFKLEENFEDDNDFWYQLNEKTRKKTQYFLYKLSRLALNHSEFDKNLIKVLTSFIKV